LDEETLKLLAVKKLGDNNCAADLPNSPIVRSWWNCMEPLLKTNADNSPVVTPLREVFHLD